MIREHIRSTLSGWLVAPLLIFAEAAVTYGFVTETAMDPLRGWAIAGYLVLLALSTVMFFGFFTVNPNEARVLQLFGKYAGTVKRDGFHWANPLLRKRRLSLRVRNFESSKIKVNDH